jgi:hypothetical protein
MCSLDILPQANKELLEDLPDMLQLLVFLVFKEQRALIVHSHITVVEKTILKMSHEQEAVAV